MTKRINRTVAKAQAIIPQVKRWRRYLHQYPELSFKEDQTARFVADQLKKCPGMKIRTNIAQTGVIGTVTSGSGPTIAIRADMDALPIHEQTDHHYRSKNDGVMHACGHDAHTAILLGVAKLISDRMAEGDLCGTVKFIFQPAEETTDEEGYSGALRMIQAGVLDEVEAVFALHVCPWHPVGVIQLHDGYSMANVDVFHGTLFGSDGHGGYPHLTKDPIWMLGAVLQSFYSIISRRISPLETAAASIGKIETGTASNIIPGKVEMTGTLRSYTEETREQLIKETERVFQVVEPLGGTYELVIERGEPALKNDPELNKLIAQVANDLYPMLKIERAPFGMGGEDFGYMTKKVPGAMFFLGCAIDDGIQRDLHTNTFDLDENCLEVGVALLAETASQWLNHRGKV